MPWILLWNISSTVIWPSILPNTRKRRGQTQGDITSQILKGLVAGDMPSGLEAAGLYHSRRDGRSSLTAP